MQRDSFVRDDRIRRSPDYRRIYRNGRRFYAQHLILYVEKSPDTRTRVGITVKKSHTNVVRNRVKRRLREIARRNRDLLPATPLQIVIHFRSEGEVSFAALFRDYSALMKEVTRWCASSS